ncbi:FecR family protein [Zunongwangia mangrovi]|uniref:FecR family protein n=1 Tax=Zunongwangia mangrovi TaxID=1334022 RepID=A0A1I1NEH5_9FLAO|nr:FecR family protein [Zunongwangia mangrovi]SFC92110.1 FecR family protein [Zunongwangia mangrovi]
MKINDLIVKKIVGKLSLKEAQFFDEWLNESVKNRKFYEGLKELHYRKNEEFQKLSTLDVDQAWKKVHSRSFNNNRKLFPYKSVFRYAAILIGVLLMSTLLYQQFSIVNDDFEISNNVRLTLADGSYKYFSEDSVEFLKDDNGDTILRYSNNVITYYKGENAGAFKSNYHSLKIPNGIKTKIQFSDGSSVFLNSGSTLKYPIAFTGNVREIQLTGEGFFKVSKDKTHPFVVNSSNLNIEVLGTIFNVRAYPENAEIEAVLVEGTIALSSDNPRHVHQYFMEPGELGIWSNTEKPVINEVDTDLYTGWTEGKLIFQNLNFKEISRRLERQYNIQIENHYKALNEKSFTATFDVESLEDILDSFKSHTPFSYKISENRIEIYEP